MKMQHVHIIIHLDENFIRTWNPCPLSQVKFAHSRSSIFCFEIPTPVTLTAALKLSVYKTTFGVVISPDSVFLIS